MKKKTSRYTSLLLMLTSCLLLVVVPLHAQEKSNKPSDNSHQKHTSLYQGTSIGVEIAGPINYFVLGSDMVSSEIQLQTNLKNRYFPTLEIGYGKADKLNDSNDLHYKTSAPYFRIGMDYNVFYKKTHLPGYLAVGLRYGSSSFNYDVNGPDMTDPNYGGQITVPFHYEGIKSSASWLEAVISIKVRIYQRFHMGWAVRYKVRIKADESENTVPWYIPGFGKNASSNFNLTYNLTYNLPF